MNSILCDLPSLLFLHHYEKQYLFVTTMHVCALQLQFRLFWFSNVFLQMLNKADKYNTQSEQITTTDTTKQTKKEKDEYSSTSKLAVCPKLTVTPLYLHSKVLNEVGIEA